jgi:serine/threonine protein kinase
LTSAGSTARSTDARFGPFTLLHQLGAGGMGQVFLASQVGEHGIRRLVAVKRILSHLSSDETLVQLFLDEVRIAAQINHGNIIQVVDHGCIDGQYYMAMEYVHGETLGDVMATLRGAKQRIPLDVLLHVACGVCEGLDHAHRKAGLDGRPLGIVHRDISPQNVMLSFEGEVKIADFGVARAAEQTHQTLGGELRGKISYMSPEQAYGKALDQRSDLFSLGLVLYEALTGVNPVHRGNQMATLEAVRAAEIEPLDALRPDLPQEVLEVVASALQRSADHRPNSARAMHEALQRAMRVNNMACSAFDLSDYLRELFPLASGEKPEVEWQDRTAQGRRADELHDVEDRSEEPSSDEFRARLTYTLAYLAERKPEGIVSMPSSTGMLTVQRSRFPTGVVLLALVLLAGGAVGGYLAIKRYMQRGFVVSPGPEAGPPAPADVGVDAKPPARLDSAPPADARASRNLGTLVIQTSPKGCNISVNGKGRGRAPGRFYVKPGVYRLRAEKSGYGVVQRTVRVKKGRYKRVTLRLLPLPSKLIVSGRPSCKLKINGAAVGNTPVTRALAHGQVRLECHYKQAVARRAIRLKPGQTTRVQLGFGHLTINLQPWAKVVIDGKARGDTPMRLLLAAGRHRVTISNPKLGRTRTKTITVRPGATTRLSSW